MTTSDRNDLHSVARAWVLKLASGGATASDAAALREWIAADSEHQRAFERARKLWHNSQALEPAFRRKPEAPARAVLGRRALAIAASIALLVTAPAMLDAWRLETADFRSAVGEVTRFQLRDGSIVWLDSGAALDENFSEHRRDVALLRGRAFFQVVHNASRPFVVAAGEGTATAVGTAFSVSREPHDAVVIVEEGRVRVARGGNEQLLAAHTRGGWNDSRTLSNVQSTGAETPDSWRWGRIVVQNEPLASAVAELDRYYPGVILVRAGADARVSGRFEVSRVEGSLSALAESQGLKVTHWTPWVTVLSK